MPVQTRNQQRSSSFGVVATPFASANVAAVVVASSVASSVKPSRTRVSASASHHSSRDNFHPNHMTLRSGRVL